MRSLANIEEVLVVTCCRAQGYPLEGVPEVGLPNTNLRGRVT
jgi:hypothetical protein